MCGTLKAHTAQLLCLCGISMATINPTTALEKPCAVNISAVGYHYSQSTPSSNHYFRRQILRLLRKQNIKQKSYCNEKSIPISLFFRPSFRWQFFIPGPYLSFYFCIFILSNLIYFCFSHYLYTNSSYLLCLRKAFQNTLMSTQSIIN